MNEIKKLLLSVDEKSKKQVLEHFAKAFTKQAMENLNGIWFLSVHKPDAI